MGLAATSTGNYSSQCSIISTIYDTSINISSTLKSKISSLAENIFSGDSGSFQWHKHLLKRLEKWETQLDKFIPSFGLQTKYDQLMACIRHEFNSPDCSWNRFNSWLEDNGHQHWFLQLGDFLAKLPLKAARNILRLVATIIKTAICVPLETVVHPLKAPLKLARLLVTLVYNLTQPETWTKIGTGMLGTSLATTTFSSNPAGILGIGIGAALAVSGISLGTLKTILFAERQERFNSAKDYLLGQAKNIPEDLLTGYCLGLLVHGIQKIIHEWQKMRLRKEHKNELKLVDEENNRRINDVNTRNARTIDDIKRQNQALIAESKSSYIDQTYREFLEKHNLPYPDRYNKGDQTFSVRWQMERVQNGDFPMHDLPEGMFTLEDLQTGVIETQKDVWIEGYYTNVKVEMQACRFIRHESGTIDYIPAVYQYVPSWTPGHWDVAVTKSPIYNKFVGFNIPVKGWVPPPQLEVPPLLPAPDLLPLPVEPSLPDLAALGNDSALLLNGALANVKD